MVFSAILFFVYGSIFGSFLNMLLWRLPREEGVGGRSKCPACGHRLSWFDLIPIVSFLTLRGKCRYCSRKISKRYLYVEIICGLTVMIFALTHYNTVSFPIFSILALLIFLSLAFFDLYFYILPDVITIPAIIGFALYSLWASVSFWPIIVGLLYALFFGIIYMVSKGKWLGFGDVKLVLLIGLVFGYPLGFLVIVAGIWLGAGIALWLLISKRATWGKALPFGTFLSSAAVIFIMFQNEIHYFERFFK